MKELSLHILDIAENSVAAKATLIEIGIEESSSDDSVLISIIDNGCGMSAEMVQGVINPFVTSRTTRKIGLGIPLFKDAAERAGGGLTITSQVGHGTEITATFVRSHIDRQPLGDMAGTVLSLVTTNVHIDFLYTHRLDGKEFVFDTREIRNVLGGVPFTDNEVYLWLSEYLKEGEQSLN